MQRRSCRRQTHAATIAKGVGVQNGQNLLNRSQAHDGGRMVNEGEGNVATFEEKGLKQKRKG